MYQTIVQAVLSHGEETPDKMAIGFQKTRVTYGQLCSQVKAMAAKLALEYGVQKGDFVMLQGVSKPDYVVAYLAIQYLGAVSIPTDKAAKEENILDVYRYTQPRVMLTDLPITAGDVNMVSLEKLYEDVAAETQEKGVEETEVSKAMPEKAGDVPEKMTGTFPAYTAPEASAAAEILFTTGTTGKPKGTMLSIGNIYASMHNTWHGVGMITEDCVLIPLPLNHSLGMRVLRTALYIGASVVIQNGFTFAKEIDNNITEFGCTGMVSVPASMELMYRQMRRHFQRIMGQLRYIEVGAGSLGYAMKKKLIEEIPNTRVVNTWGSTETGGAIFLCIPEHPDKLTSLGHPIDTVELKVIDTEGNDITEKARDIDSAGRMVLRGDMQMMGYYKMPEATAEALVDGWLYTNDIIYTDEDGYVYMLGRADDIINVGGEKVSPLEVENVAQEFEEIRECACIGIKDPDDVLGQIPVLFVVPENKEFHPELLTRFMSARVEKYKLPLRFEIIEELPRNRMQKLNRKELHRMWDEKYGK